MDEFERLAHALRIFADYRGSTTPPEVWLEQHEEYRDLLAPMLEQDEDLGSDPQIDTDSGPGEDSGDRTISMRMETPPDLNDAAASPPITATAASPRSDLATVGDMIGPYRILDAIGEGGMGAVYLAEQREPIRRKVALKLIERGLDTKEVLTRFRIEYQILSLMQHPSIARVYDAGETPNGCPYFVMEHVSGIPIGQYCDRERLSTTARLELFDQVCHAVQHAHQKGVIHRDLKPSNILVAMQDGRPVAKVIDFGIAKSIWQSVTEQTHHTRLGTVIGTLEYMSPEQAESAMDIDTRSDLYSLGVVLYQLLTGMLPFDSLGLERDGLDEIRRVVREIDPPKPSTRIGTAAQEESQTVARARRSDTRALARRLRGDLDWIVMKCLEKDRTRRYDSAAELSADIQRHLRDEPVLAGPPSSTYRLRKFIRRRRALFTFGLISVVGVLSALVVISALYFLAEERYQEIVRLSDLKRVADYTEAANELWPAKPGLVDDLEAWLVRARELASGLSGHRRTLEELTQGAADAPSEERSASLGWRIETLRTLIRQLEAFTDEDPRVGAIRSVEDRLEFARTIEQRSLRDYSSEWSDAQAYCAQEAPDRTPSYAGLDLEPILGLVPLGPDPETGLLEFVDLYTGDLPTRDSKGRWVLAESTGVVFVLVPGGEFVLGAWQRGKKPDGGGVIGIEDRWASSNEAPPQRLDVAPFLLSKYELTQAQWRRMTGEVPAVHPPGSTSRGGVEVTALHPVESISWEKATLELSRVRMTLPTEVQWEYACRAATTTPWITGDSPRSLSGHANLADEGSRRFRSRGIAFERFIDDGYDIHAPVGSFRPNGFGLYDMHGNVWEWCLDVYGSYEFPVQGPRRERSVVLEENEVLERVVRGGGFGTPAAQHRSSSRQRWKPNLSDQFLGVRPVLTWSAAER